MHPVPHEDALRPLVGQRLQLIGCSSNQLTLHFDRGDSLTADSEFLMMKPPGPAETIHVPPRTAALFELLAARIDAVSARDDGRGLTLTFESGVCLSFSSSAGYEDFHLAVAGREHHI